MTQNTSIMETLIFTVQAICFWFALGVALVIVGNQVLSITKKVK